MMTITARSGSQVDGTELTENGTIPLCKGNYYSLRGQVA